MLPKLDTIDFDIVRKCIAPTYILMMNSNKNLEDQVHQITFKELSFKLDAEIDNQKTDHVGKQLDSYQMFAMSQRIRNGISLE